MELNGSVAASQDGPTSRRSRSPSPDLHYGSFTNSLASLTSRAREEDEGQGGREWSASSPRCQRAHLAVAVLCYINLLNYMERYTIAGVLPKIQEFFDIGDSRAALLQTVLIISFLLLAPLFGYLGDRYNRKYIMIGGLAVWSVTSGCSSFVTKSQFWLLMLLRAIVGIGEASYTTIAPTIIGDLFAGAQRSVMICFFYIFIPVGSGLGFIAGSGVANLTGDWRWALRITPILGLVGIVLLAVACPNPARGAAEMRSDRLVEKSSYIEDVKYLLKNKSYVWSSLGITASTFNLGALAFWVPTFLTRARVFLGLLPLCTKGSCPTSDSLTFGAVTLVTGILGGCGGTFLSRMFRDRVQYVDPLICAAGLLGSVPCFLVTIFVASASIPITYVFVALGETLVALNWAVMADILLYVVVPHRRSTAEALQVTVIHLLGDSGSPYLVGLISDSIQSVHPETPDWSFRSLQYSLLLCPAVGLLGGLFYLVCIWYIAEDSRAVARYVSEDPPVPPEPNVTEENQTT